jgi:hypothetical protein
MDSSVLSSSSLPVQISRLFLQCKGTENPEKSKKKRKAGFYRRGSENAEKNKKRAV